MATSTAKTPIAIACRLCNATRNEDLSGHRCVVCKRLDRSELFLKILEALKETSAICIAFDAVKQKCEQYHPMVQEFSLASESYQIFSNELFDIDRAAQVYLRQYVPAEDKDILGKYLPVKMNSPRRGCVYTAIALLCQLDMEAGAIELRVRNVIDLVLNVTSYQSDNEELHECLNWQETWENFVVNLLYLDSVSVNTHRTKCVILSFPLEKFSEYT